MDKATTNHVSMFASDISFRNPGQFEKDATALTARKTYDDVLEEVAEQ